MSKLRCCWSSCTFWHRHAPEREGDVYHGECEENQITIAFDFVMMIFWDSKVRGWNEFFPTQASMRKEDNDTSDIKIRPGCTLENGVFQLVDVTHGDRGDGLIVRPEESQL